MTPTPSPQSVKILGTLSAGIPEAVRRHGRVINPNVLEPGDLILVEAVRPGWIQRKIQTTQKKLFEWDHARWHHAVVSGGGTEVCEALFGGVIAREYWEYMTGDYTVRVRRIAEATIAERTKVAYYAASMARTAYGFGAILPIRRSISTKDPWRRRIWRSRGVICSQLYFEACMRNGILLGNMPPDHVSPAHLSASQAMVDVEIEWIQLQASAPQTAPARAYGSSGPSDDRREGH